MKEDLLQFIWQKQLFSGELVSDKGHQLRVIHPGALNRLSGPDFSNAKIKIDDILWVGNVEIHVNEKDWFHHKHERDPAYENIILHVVYDKDFKDASTGHLSLNLFDKINPSMLDRYEQLMNSMHQLPCANHLKIMEKSKLRMWLDAMGLERFQSKVIDYKKLLKDTQYDFDYLLMYVLFKSFGFSMNTAAFEQMATKLHPSFFYRLKQEPEKAALLLKGMSGMELSLEEVSEFDVLCKRFKISAVESAFWKKGALRPANRPEIRLLQLADMMLNFESIRNALLAQKDLNEVLRLLSFKHNSLPYPIGHASKEGVLVNALVPFVFIYADFESNQELKEYAVDILDALKAEKNRFTRVFAHNGLHASSALESQALIHLFRNYCRPKKCLNCAIGNDVLLNHDRKN